jgi:hypothetical protein
MLPIFVGIVSSCAIVVGLAFILSRTVPRLRRNKAYRFVFLFLLGVPVIIAINYIDVSTLGYHKMGWIGTFISAFLFAICGTFWPTTAARQ